MNTRARSRLAAQAAAAGYPPDLLALIAHATLPGYRPGEQLDDPQIEQVTGAVEVLAQAGYTSANLPTQLAEYQQRDGEDWRERFWSRALRSASVRYATRTSTGSRPARSTPTGSPSTPARRPAKRRAPPEPDPPLDIERRAR